VKEGQLDWKVLSDREFAEALEICEMPNEYFHHIDHVRLAWIYLRELPEEDAMERMARTLKRFAAHNGRPERYHHTRTLAWMQLVVAAARTTPAIKTFAEFISAHPHLEDQQTLLLHYSKNLLDSPDARAGWVGPDLLSLPAPAPRTKSSEIALTT
jgi:hypothetical protein